MVLFVAVVAGVDVVAVVAAADVEVDAQIVVVMSGVGTVGNDYSAAVVVDVNVFVVEDVVVLDQELALKSEISYSVEKLDFW